MDIKTKQEKLKEIYNDFIIRAQPFMVNAVCKPGCSFCCTHFGHVDIITLEGYIIHEWMETLSKSDQIDLRKKIVKNMKKKKKRSITRCPFLSMDNTCRIYDIRPFSCRQLYSLETCTAKGPIVHRKSVEMAKMTCNRIFRAPELHSSSDLYARFQRTLSNRRIQSCPNHVFWKKIRYWY